MLPVDQIPPPKTKIVSSPRQLLILLVLLAAGGLNAVTGTIVSPVFPEVVEQFQIDPRWAGLLVSTHTLTIALFSPLLGILADRVGKLKVLTPSLILYAVFGASGALMQGFGSMLAARALVGAASGGIAAASIGMVSGMYEGEARSRVMGYATSALATASIIFPLLGGWAGSFHWRFAFCLYGLGLPVALAVVLFLREENRKRTVTIDLSQSQKLRHQLRQPDILTFFLALGLASAVFYVVIVYAPLFFKAAIGAGPVINGAILASRAVGAALISALGANRLAKRLGVTPSITLGFIVMALTLLTIPFLVQVPLILLTAFLFGIGFGIVMPNLYISLSERASADQRTGILAIGTGAASIGQFVSPILLGPIWKNAGVAVFYVAAGVAVTIGVLALLSQKRLQTTHR
ncbi:MAG: MFS transporter [Leptolyngbyaceae cyanobacterium MO_188.B28]|nr:MFS transporter [Leptolyngbyaceae cyanobacterium MO_188.B28]